MTPLDLTAARTRLFHWWEMNGLSGNPAATIRRIACDIAPAPDARGQLEDVLLDEWARLCAQEGVDDDYAA